MTFWTYPTMIAAYLFCLIGVVCVVFAVREFRNTHSDPASHHQHNDPEEAEAVFTTDEVEIALCVLAALTDSQLDRLSFGGGDSTVIRQTALRARIVLRSKELPDGSRQLDAMGIRYRVVGTE